MFNLRTTASIVGSIVLAIVSLSSLAEAASTEPLAEVNGAAITAEEVEKALGGQLAKLQEQIYALKRQKVEALIDQKLLAAEAAKRRISVQALLDTEVTSKVGLVTEQEVEAFYQANKTQLQGEEPALREQIRNHLQNQKLAARRDVFLESLRSQAKIAIHLQPPPVSRIDVPVNGSAFRGPAQAPLTIVEFQDFHCPFCRRVQSTLTAIQSKYGDKVKIVHRDFPIDQLHPQARKAHEAARCAGDQGKFWPYHDVLYAKAPAGPDQLKVFAQDLGLTLRDFEQCLNSGKYQATVEADVREGKRLGVTGTPTFFINGRLLTGAQPLEQFVQVIEDELRRWR